MRRAWAGVCVVVMIVAGGCSDGEMSLNEYVERLSAATDPAIQRGEELVAESEQITDFSLELSFSSEVGRWEVVLYLDGELHRSHVFYVYDSP